MAGRQEMRRQIKDLILSAQAQGWTAEMRGTGHWALYAPGGGMVVMAATPSDHRAVKNIVSVMRRYGYQTEREIERASRRPATPNPTLTFKQATETIMAKLEAAGWTVSRAASWGKALKLPYATSADQTCRVWFKPQALWFSAGPPHSFKTARSTHDDPRELAVMESTRLAGHLAKICLTWRNPVPGLPGGTMSECIRRMEKRPDVESPGALCQWLAQRSGERLVRSPTVRKKMSPELRKIMRRFQ